MQERAAVIRVKGQGDTCHFSHAIPMAVRNVIRLLDVCHPRNVFIFDLHKIPVAL